MPSRLLVGRQMPLGATSLAVGTSPRISGAKAPVYWSLQLKIPPELPDLLKDYTKAVLREQPEDLVSFSALYFRRLAGLGSALLDIGDVLGNQPLDAAQAAQEGRMLDVEGVWALHNIYGNPDQDTPVVGLVVPYVDVEQTWTQLGYTKNQLSEIMSLCEFYSGEVPWLKFSAVLCCAVSMNVMKSLSLCLKLWQRLNVYAFEEIVRFLGKLDQDISQEAIDEFVAYFATQFPEDITVDGFVEHENTCPQLLNEDQS